MGPLVHKYTGVALPTVVPSGVVEQEQPVRSSSYSTTSAPGGMSQSITFGSNPGEVTGVRVEMSNNFFPTPSSFYLDWFVLHFTKIYLIALRDHHSLHLHSIMLLISTVVLLQVSILFFRGGRQQLLQNMY